MRVERVFFRSIMMGSKKFKFIQGFPESLMFADFDNIPGEVIVIEIDEEIDLR